MYIEHIYRIYILDVDKGFDVICFDRVILRRHNLEGALRCGRMEVLSELARACDVLEVMRVEEILDIDLLEASRLRDLHELLEGGEKFVEQSIELEEQYDQRLLLQRPSKMIASAHDAADFAKRRVQRETRCYIYNHMNHI